MEPGTGEQLLAVGAPQTSDKLSTKDFTEHFDGKEERVLGVNPARLVRRNTAAGNDAVDVRMEQEILAPGVKDAEETDLGTEMLEAPRNLAESFSDGAEQEVVELGLILQNQ
jgi:hypothetical protein